MPQASFFLMGCWNNDNCRQFDPTRPTGVIGSNDGKDYRRAVIECIAKKTPRYDFGVIAGDNIYPRMPLTKPGAPFIKNITKIYYQRTLDYGFGLLDDLKIPYYTVYGNHDVVKSDVLDAELHRARNNKNKNTHGKTQYVAEVVPGKLRVVVIDTNLLQLELTEPTKRLYGIQTVTDAWRVMSRFLESVRAPGFKGWTLVVGHEPIFTTKKQYVLGLVYYKELVAALQAIPKMVYICADLHAFQVSEIITDNAGTGFPMVVVGTGGANPDVVKTEAAKPDMELEGGIRWRVKDSMSAYGYCEGRLHANKLSLTFLPLKHCTQGQQKVRVVFTASGMEVRRMGKRIPYRPDQCAARPVLPELCVNDPRENPRLEGIGRYVRRAYRINQKK